MDRAYTGIIIGFFLAVFLMMAAVKVQLGPLEPSITAAMPEIKLVYSVTHSGIYQDMTDLAVWANSTAEKISSLPLVGQLMPTEVSDTASGLISLLGSAKLVSENLLSAMEMVLFLINISLPAMIVSLIIVAAGVYLLVKENGGKAQPKARK